MYEREREREKEREREREKEKRTRAKGDSFDNTTNSQVDEVATRERRSPATRHWNMRGVYIPVMNSLSCF